MFCVIASSGMYVVQYSSPPGDTSPESELAKQNVVVGQRLRRPGQGASGNVYLAQSNTEGGAANDNNKSN